jgi:acyl dehydratase
VSVHAGHVEVGDIVVDVDHVPDERQLFLFSAATHNAHRIHYDLPYAQSEGYPALVVHGPLQRALMARFILSWAGPSARLTRLRLQHRSSAAVGHAIRFRAEVVEVDPLADPAVGGAELSLTATDDAGRTLMSGTASVALAIDRASR